MKYRKKSIPLFLQSQYTHTHTCTHRQAYRMQNIKTIFRLFLSTLIILSMLHTIPFCLSLFRLLAVLLFILFHLFYCCRCCCCCCSGFRFSGIQTKAIYIDNAFFRFFFLFLLLYFSVIFVVAIVDDTPIGRSVSPRSAVIPNVNRSMRCDYRQNKFTCFDFSRMNTPHRIEADPHFFFCSEVAFVIYLSLVDKNSFQLAFIDFSLRCAATHYSPYRLPGVCLCLCGYWGEWAAVYIS